MADTSPSGADKNNWKKFDKAGTTGIADEKKNEDSEDSNVRNSEETYFGKSTSNDSMKSQEYPVHDTSNEFLRSQTNLFSFEDTEPHSNYHFGLIRGYHRELYDDNSRREFLCCTVDDETANRIRRHHPVPSWQITGVLFGSVFVFFGLTSLIASFLVSSDETKDLFWRSLDIPSMYIHVIAIIGLTVLTVGSVLISLCLFLPLCLGHTRDMPGFWCTTGDMYIKNVENMVPNQFLYFDAAVYGNFLGKPDVKKIQPELNEKTS